jgi:hypothetical protein
MTTPKIKPCLKCLELKEKIEELKDFEEKYYRYKMLFARALEKINFLESYKTNIVTIPFKNGATK